MSGGVYDHYLPLAFPYRIEVKHLRAVFLVGLLTASHSSFALTADAPAGYRNLWLSDTSRKFLEGLDQLPTKEAAEEEP